MRFELKSRSDSPIIVALDQPHLDELNALVDKLDPHRCQLKIGKGAFTRFGPDLVKRLQRQGFQIFLDLKFHDIPNTVADACKAAADLGVWMLNVHALGGSRMLQAAKDALASYGPKQPILLAVTILTSLAAADLAELGLQGEISTWVERLAGLAQQCGLDGVVCSANEADSLRNRLGSEFCLVTPGIRLAKDTPFDQRRVMTPVAALDAGAHYLVIGRPITQAKDPLSVLDQIELDLK